MDGLRFFAPFHINQPGVGSNVFVYTSDIRTDCVLSDATNYELYSYEELGRGEPKLVETNREIITG